MNVNILFYAYLRDDNQTRSIGGVQTYIYNLCNVIKKIGWTPIIYQAASNDFRTTVDGITVIGVKCDRNKFTQVAIKLVPRNEIVIFGSEELAQEYDGISISIQHGIYWDKPEKRKLGQFFIWLKTKRAVALMKKLNLVNEIVCVDCNFINWYRTQVAKQEIKLTYIPNFSEVPGIFDKNSNEKIKIIFARRFVEFRGTRVFTKAIIEILEKYPNIEVTIAGEGPDEQWMKSALGKYNNVFFTKYENADSINVHSDKHIAVVPTIGSEGTSLSLLEAMAAQCAVICTDVGGMTNIVLDGHNGLLVQANNVEELRLAIEKLVVDEDLRNKLSNNAYHTIIDSFSYDSWESKWLKVLQQYEEKESD